MRDGGAEVDLGIILVLGSSELFIDKDNIQRSLIPGTKITQIYEVSYLKSI